jgi:prophage antirepressor-like protein
MADLKVEAWKNYEIRFVWHNDEWWAVAKDVADALGYRMASDMTRNLDKEEKDTQIVRTPGGTQKMTVISETGIYEAIFNSRRPEAKEFKAWVKQALKELRQQAGLEGFQVFRMLDKEHQKEMMARINEINKNAEPRDYIKANTIANKVISTRYGFQKMIKKGEMTPEMLRDRQPILEDTVNLMKAKEDFGLDISVSEAIKKKWN